MTLLGAHLRPEILMSPNVVPAPDALGYLFVRTEAHHAACVHTRLADAGAFSGQARADMRAVPDLSRGDFPLLHASAPVPRAAEPARAGTDPAEERRRGEGQQPAAPALQTCFGAAGFHPIDAAARRRPGRLGDGVWQARTDVA